MISIIQVTKHCSLDQLEEHGLILAIQAAHQARTKGFTSEIEEGNQFELENISRVSSRVDVSSS